jgi:DNA invertase Pin-like site-specific DNA recombinase
MKSTAAASFGAPPSPYAGRLGIIYSRVSTKGQRADAQDVRCTSYLASIGVPLHTAFSDSFTGGGDFMQRPAMRQLLAYIDASPHRSFVVVFDDLKRFARDTEFHLKLRDAFRRRDVLLACLNYNFEDSPEGRFAETVFAAQAELERHQNRRQVIQKMKARLERGYWTFCRKRGYDIVKDPAHGKLAVPNADGRLLAQAFEGLASGRFVRKIDACRFLFDRGFPCGREPSRFLDRLTAMLSDPFYCGDIEYPEWGISRRPGHHEALISRTVFDRMQARLKKADGGRSVRVDVSEEFPLRRLLVCASCDKHLTAARSKGRTKWYAYYFCANKPCSQYAVSLPKADVERDFLDVLKRNRLKPKAEGVLELMFDRAWDGELSDAKHLVKQREQFAATLNERIADFARLSRETQSSTVRRSYEQQIEETAVELEAAEADETPEPDLHIPYRTALEKASGLLKTPVSTWKKADAAEKQTLFFLLFEAKLAYGKNEGYRTAEKLSATRLFEEFSSSNSKYVQSDGDTSNGRGTCTVEQTEARAVSFRRLKGYLARFWERYQSSPMLQDVLSKG